MSARTPADALWSLVGALPGVGRTRWYDWEVVKVHTLADMEAPRRETRSPMTSADQYRKLAAELRAAAAGTANRSVAAQLLQLARSYIRLAEQADKKTVSPMFRLRSERSHPKRTKELSTSGSATFQPPSGWQKHLSAAPEFVKILPLGGGALGGAANGNRGRVIS